MLVTQKTGRGSLLFAVLALTIWPCTPFEVSTGTLSNDISLSNTPPPVSLEGGGAGLNPEQCWSSGQAPILTVVVVPTLDLEIDPTPLEQLRGSEGCSGDSLVLVEYVGRRGYLALVSGSTHARALRKSLGVQVLAVPAGMKIDHGSLDRAPVLWEDSLGGTMAGELVVRYATGVWLSGAECQAIREAAGTHAVTVCSEDSDSDQILSANIRVLGPTAELVRSEMEMVAEGVAGLGMVVWIAAGALGRSENTYARQLSQGGSDMDNWAENHSLNGRGQVVAVADSGLDVNSCFFRDDQHPVMFDTVMTDHRKLVAYSTRNGDSKDEKGGHGTHVSGTVAGAPLGNENVEHRGMAPEAKLYFADLNKGGGPSLTLPVDLQNLFRPAQAAGAHIHSNSWQILARNEYSSHSHEIDAFMFNNPDSLVIFASGNDGTCGAFSISAEGNSKNALLVGASMTVEAEAKQQCGKLGSCGEVDLQPRPIDRNLAPFSGRGPTADGRFKPDVVAVGDTVTSACASGNDRTTCRLVPMKGTSMATPVVSGSAALVRQYFIDGHYNGNPFTPSGALIKAVLIHSARHLTSYKSSGPSGGWRQVPFTVGPSPVDGFGAIRLSNVLGFKDSPFRLFVAEHPASVQMGERREYCFEVDGASPDVPFRATLTYNDPPASMFATKTLVNNLDLEVITGDNRSILGNGRDEYGRADVENNVEQVTLSSGLGRAAIRVVVHGVKVLHQKSQEFALVVTGANLRFAESEHQCPAVQCRNGCSNLPDLCDKPKQRCNCVDRGVDCSALICPGNCYTHGQCVEWNGAGRCVCDPGYGGADCRILSVPLEPSQWTAQRLHHYPTPEGGNFTVQFPASEKKYFNFVARSTRPTIAAEMRKNAWANRLVYSFSTRAQGASGDVKSTSSKDERRSSSVVLKSTGGSGDRVYRVDMKAAGSNRLWCYDDVRVRAELTDTPVCPDNCSGHGVCSIVADAKEESGVRPKCTCDSGWTTEAATSSWGGLLTDSRGTRGICGTYEGTCSIALPDSPCGTYGGPFWTHEPAPSDMKEQWETARTEWFGVWEHNSDDCKAAAKTLFCMEMVPSCVLGGRMCRDSCIYMALTHRWLNQDGGQWPDSLCYYQPTTECYAYIENFFTVLLIVLVVGGFVCCCIIPGIIFGSCYICFRTKNNKAPPSVALRQDLQRDGWELMTDGSEGEEHETQASRNSMGATRAEHRPVVHVGHAEEMQLTPAKTSVPEKSDE